MSDVVFYELSEVAQLEKLESFAREALKSWALETADIWLLKYRENCVFGVRDIKTDTKYAMRIHRPDYHCLEALKSELLWVEALAKDGVLTPDIIHTQKGDLLITCETEQVPEPRVCDLLGWVEGEQLGNIEGEGDLSNEDVYANHLLAGKVAAQIHNQAEGWTIPEGFKRPMMDAEGLVGKTGYLGDFRTHPDLTPEQLSILTKAADKAIDAMNGFGQAPDCFGLTHADFLPENLLIKDGDVRIIDFDDCGFGWYMMDLATSLFFLQGEDCYQSAYDGFVKGYRSTRNLPDDHLAMLPSCYIMRALAYVGWTATRHQTPAAQELSPILIEMALGLADVYLKN